MSLFRPSITLFRPPATECYLKISFPPYLLELDLHGCIDSSQPRARTERGILFIKAKKKEGHIGIWGVLGSVADRKSDPEVRIRREESIKGQLKQEQEVSRNNIYYGRFVCCHVRQPAAPICCGSLACKRYLWQRLVFRNSLACYARSWMTDFSCTLASGVAIFEFTNRIQLPVHIHI